jgi:uncharacterized protein (TIGR03435 family)
MTMSRRFPLFRLAALLFLATLGFACAQPPAEDLAPVPKASLLSAPTKPIEFDIATFRRSRPGDGERKLGLTGDSFTMENRPFHDLIRFAFAKGRGGAYRITGPAWVDTDPYDIEAKVAPEDIAEWQRLNGVGQKVALQGFLIEYLKLKFHQDPTPYPFYALVVAKSGLKMPLYQPGDSFKTPDGQTLSTRGVLVWVSGNEMIGLDCRTERLVDQLSGRADLGVIDQTGLMPNGYSFKLQFDDGPDGTPFRALHPDDATAAIRVALKQLGLELKSTTGPIDSMVIDHIERPPEN